MEKKVKDKEVLVNSEVGVTNSGNRFYSPLKWKWSDFDKQMIPYYDDNDKIDIYKSIQASSTSCDILAIIERAKLGDTTRINFANPDMYNWPDSDVSELPNNINDMNAMQKQAYDSFNNLDPNIKAVFGNNLETFLTALNNGTYASMVANSMKKEPSKEKGNESNESEESK